MGIGGSGMTPLADLVKRSGGMVSGCDANVGPSTMALRAIGISIDVGHDAAHVAGCGALIITSAIPGAHPEVVAARRAGIPVLKRAEALGAIVNRGTVIGIAGTHGKTTTTAMTTAALAAAGLDPTGLVGGRVPAWDGNLRPGGDKLFVVEADEYDRSFLTLRPSIAVVTTLEADHLDIYESLTGVEDAFLAFLERVPADGTVIGCADDPGVGRLLPRLARGPRMLTYGLNAGSVVRGESVETSGTETTFYVREEGRLLGRARLAVPGTHNVRNALAAIAVARELDVDWDVVAEGIASYAGVHRRFEVLGEADGVVFVDDYAHHPTEISTTLHAARSAFPGRRLVAVFQPHLYSRTRDFAVEFGRSLAPADLIFVTDVYGAREEPIPGVTGDLLVTHARSAGGDVRYVPDRATVTEVVAAELRPGDLCLTLGAGDLDRAARELLALLEGASTGGGGVA